MRLPRLRFGIRSMLAAVTILAVYLGAYFALLAPIILVESAHLGMVVSGYREAHYSVADPVSRIAFAPIHFVDSRIRSDYWGPYSDF